MAEKGENRIAKIRELLQDGPKSISDITEGAEVDWKTAEKYLSLFEELGFAFERETDNKRKRVFFLKDPNNYFKLPIKQEHQKIISTAYFYIKKYCNELFQKEPTKTQVYKILWKLNIENLPIGWYKYGPIAIQPYRGDEQDYGININKNLIKETVTNYCNKDNIELQKQIYKEANNQLYLTKEKLLEENLEKQELNIILMDLIKYAPKEEVVDYFVRAVMLQRFTNQLKKYFFEKLWPLITKINLRNDLEPYYSESINYYFDEDIDKSREEALSMITEIIESYMDTKYSQDKRYQSWKKNRQSDPHSE